MSDGVVNSAVQLSEQAVAVVARLKTGSLESAQTLALISIAKSLAALAASPAFHRPPSPTDPPRGPGPT